MQHAQKLESLGVLAGGIAHDFNNLLMAILGNADLALLWLPPDSPAESKLREIEAAARRAADLCRQMLAYSGKAQFATQPVNLSTVADEMAGLFKVSISENAALRCDLPAHLPSIEADAAQLRQVIMNLITNASEALNEGSGTISISTGQITCHRAYLADLDAGANLAEGDYVFLEVSDTGCGMDADTRARMFEPFFTTKFPGRGLGLAAVLGIVRAHHGAVKVRSEPERGASVTILFPVRKPTSPNRVPDPS